MRSPLYILLILFLVLLLIVSSPASGQGMEMKNPYTKYDEVYLTQVAISNRIDILSAEIEGNQAITYQSGQLQHIILYQQGDNNIANLHQLGNSNTIDLRESGRDIASSIAQYGNENKAFIELMGSNISIDIIQEGNQHSITDRGNKSNKSGYSIKQSGLVGMTVLIRHY